MAQAASQSFSKASGTLKDRPAFLQGRSREGYSQIAHSRKRGKPSRSDSKAAGTAPQVPQLGNVRRVLDPLREYESRQFDRKPTTPVQYRPVDRSLGLADGAGLLGLLPCNQQS